MSKTTIAEQQAAGRNGWPAALMLFFLTPATAELLSGSSPPTEYFGPFGLVFLHLSYGALAVLLREFAVRRGIGWWGRLLMAPAVGLFIEGVLCKSFFSPEWGDFNSPAGYGRLWGTNWSWMAGLLVYHALMSFLIPWLVVELVYPALMHESALSRGWRATLTCLLLTTGLTGYLGFPMTPGGKVVYHPGILASLVSWGSLAFFPWLATRVGPALSRATLAMPPTDWLSPRALAWLAAAWWTAFFGVMIYATTKELARLAAPVSMVVYLGFAATAVAWAWHLRGGCTLLHLHAVVQGSAWFWCVMGLIQELHNAKRPDNTLGMSVVGLAGLLAAYWLGRRLRHPRPTVRSLAPSATLSPP